jgi:hypothetical protein
MKNTLAVQKQQSFQYLSHDIARILLSAFSLLLDVLVKGSVFGNLHHNRQILPT